MGLREIEDLLRAHVEADLRENYGQEPLADSIYLYFSQKRNLTSPSVDNLFVWANSWVSEILIKNNMTRFLDRDVTSAIFCRYVLKLAGKLKIDIDMKSVNKLLEAGIKDNYYFGNTTYTALILLAIYDSKNDISSFDEVSSYLKNSITTRPILSDTKNIVFCSLLFNQLGETESLRGLVKYCLDQVTKNNIRFDDRIFYAWTLWNFRYLVQDKIMNIRNFVEASLEDFCRALQVIVADGFILDLYGQDTRSKVSRIALGLCLDLIIDYNAKMVHSSAIDTLLILQRIDSLGWTAIADMIRKALQLFDEEKTKETCDNLRMALMSILVKASEQITGQPAPLIPGQTPDPNKIMRPLVEKHVITDHQRSIVANTWSYVSELAHVEKKGGSPPTEDETRYGFQLVLSAVELVVRTLSQTR